MKLPPDATSWLLLRGRVGNAGAVEALVAALQALARESGGALARGALRRAGTGGPGADDAVDLLHAYVTGGADPARLAAAARNLAALRQPEVSTLRPAFDTPGAAAGQPARFHYVVETDPEDGWHDEIARWYDEEHMPGLAAVPGCIRATRALHLGRGPRSFAAYDLVAPDVLGSPPWLAVRGTAWSDRARPHFTNTRRTMFEVIA